MLEINVSCEYSLNKIKTERLTMTEIYVAIALKSDGTVPGICSMLHIGLAIAGVSSGVKSIKYDEEIPVNLFSLKPIGAPWRSTFGNSSERARLEVYGENVAEAMINATTWLKEYAIVNNISDPRFIPVSWPNTFDYAFIMHYFMNQNYLGSPFSISEIFTNEELFSLTDVARNKLSQPTKLKVPRKVVRNEDALDLQMSGHSK